MLLLKIAAAFVGAYIGITIVFGVLAGLLILVLGGDRAAEVSGSWLVQWGQVIVTGGGAGYVAYLVWRRAMDEEETGSGSRSGR